MKYLSLVDVQGALCSWSKSEGVLRVTKLYSSLVKRTKCEAKTIVTL